MNWLELTILILNTVITGLIHYKQIKTGKE